MKTNTILAVLLRSKISETQAEIDQLGKKAESTPGQPAVPPSGTPAVAPTGQKGSAREEVKSLKGKSRRRIRNARTPS